MANLRNLKKDIDFLVSQVVTDCFKFIGAFDNADREATYEIIADMLTMRNQLRDRVNHPDGKDNKVMVRSYYNRIAKDLVEGCDKAYDELGKLIEKAS